MEAGVPSALAKGAIFMHVIAVSAVFLHIYREKYNK
jgi:hypothetical protein